MKNQKDITIDVIMPVYNEAENIEKTLNYLYSHIKKINNKITLYIIYDFDEDNTLPIIKKIKKNYNINICLIKNKTEGILNAIKTGFSTGHGEYKILTMSDGSDDYDILPLMIKKISKGYDIICASRYMKGGKLYGGPFFKQLLSRIAGITLYYLTGIPTHDITNSYKLYNSELLKNINIESTGGAEISMEITIKAYLNNYKITEIPARWWDREKGTSQFNFSKWLPKYLKWYLFLLKNKWF